MFQANQTPILSELSKSDGLTQLNSEMSPLSAPQVLEKVITDLYSGEIALVSSFGTASVVLLHMISKIAPDLPVHFIDTGKLFDETLRYRDQVQERFGLSNIQTIAPDAECLALADRDGTLWQSDPDQCCALRKVAPLASALAPYSAWISGRKRYQNGQRQALSIVEVDGDKLKINPLTHWKAQDVQDYITVNELPVHPLIAKGYPSIGCVPCTSTVAPGEDERAGRWRGRDKTECGIHFTTNEQAVSTSSETDKLRRIKSWA